MAKHTSALLLAAWSYASYASCAQAAMAPKYERRRDLGLALDHMQEVAGLLDGPIDRIEYVAPNVVFTGGRCQVTVGINYAIGSDANGPAIPGAPRRGTAIIRPKTCR